MKILYHHRTASKDGQNVHIEELIGALRRRGHEVVVVAPAAEDRTAFGDTIGIVQRLREFLPKALFEIFEVAYSLIAYRRLSEAVRRHSPDVLYERYNLFLLSGKWAAARYSLPFLLEVNAPLCEERTLHGGLRLRALARWSERTVWRAADAVLPVTEVLAQKIREAGVKSERIQVIPNGIDRRKFHRDIDATDIRADLGIQDRLVLGFTGFIRSWHGLPHVLEAMARLGRTDIHLLVVGDGPGREELETRAAALGLTDRLTVLGLVERERIPGLTAAMDIALQPAVVSYASPLKLFEYLALGRPVIAPDQPNIREILTHEVDALLFDPEDPEGLAKAVTRLCSDSDLRERIGRAGAELIDRADRTWDGNARVVEELAGSIRDSRGGVVLPGS